MDIVLEIFYTLLFDPQSLRNAVKDATAILSSMRERVSCPPPYTAVLPARPTPIRVLLNHLV